MMAYGYTAYIRAIPVPIVALTNIGTWLEKRVSPALFLVFATICQAFLLLLCHMSRYYSYWKQCILCDMCIPT